MEKEKYKVVSHRKLLLRDRESGSNRGGIDAEKKMRTEL
jgi:hypothetical protein